MDYNISIPDIYSDPYLKNNDDFEVIDYDIDIAKLNDNYGVWSFKLMKNTTFIIIKTNIENAFIYDIKIYNNLLYFCENDNKISIRIRDTDLNFDGKYMKIYEIVKKKNQKYKIYNEPVEYCTGDENMILFKRYHKIMIFTFTINIYLYDNINKKRIKEDNIDILKLKSNNFLFVYRKVVIDKYNITLYLIGIKNLLNNKEISIDINFFDVADIYNKYQIALDKIIDLIFNSKENKYKIDMKYLETKIRGIYYPNVISIL